MGLEYFNVSLLCISLSVCFVSNAIVRMPCYCVDLLTQYASFTLHIDVFTVVYIQVNIFRTIDDPVLILWFGALDASFDIQVHRLSMLSSYMKGSHSEIFTFVFFLIKHKCKGSYIERGCPELKLNCGYKYTRHFYD